MEDFASLLEGKLIQLIYILSINQFSISDWMHKYRPLPTTKPLKLRNSTIACGPHRARIGNLENIVTWGEHMSKSSTSHGTVVLCCSSSQLWSFSVVQSLPGWRYSKSWSWPQPLPELPVMSEENKVALIVEGDCPRSHQTYQHIPRAQIAVFLAKFPRIISSSLSYVHARGNSPIKKSQRSTKGNLPHSESHVPHGMSWDISNFLDQPTRRKYSPSALKVRPGRAVPVETRVGSCTCWLTTNTWYNVCHPMIWYFFFNIRIDRYSRTNTCM